jgi:hypothetical protein
MNSCGRLFVASVLAIGLSTFGVVAKAADKKSPAPASLIKADESTSVISFVRRSVLMGDGWNYDVWDGDTYVGVLGAGNLLQYRAQPGEHTFMMMARGMHIWTYMKANVLAGKEYFARAYPLPYSLQAYDSNSDERVDEWATMKVETLTDEDRKKAIDKFGAEMQLALASFKAGEIAPDCAGWIPPKKNGKPATQPTRGKGNCRSIGEMKPEMGR